MGRRKAEAWGIGIIGFMLCGLCGAITSACDDNDPTPTRPVEQTSAPITSAPTTSAPMTVAPTTAAPTTTAPKPKATTAKPKPSPTRTTTKPKPKPPSVDTQYGTCREAKAHGLGPYYEGADPEYDWYQDRDGDGVVCE